MKKFLTLLYEMDLQANQCNPITTPSEQENMLYDSLLDKLNQEQQQKFMDFFDQHKIRIEHECEIYFKKGFRYAVRFILECFNEKF